MSLAFNHSTAVMQKLFLHLACLRTMNCFRTNFRLRQNIVLSMARQCINKQSKKSFSSSFWLSVAQRTIKSIDEQTPARAFAKCLRNSREMSENVSREKPESVSIVICHENYPALTLGLLHTRTHAHLIAFDFHNFSFFVHAVRSSSTFVLFRHEKSSIPPKQSTPDYSWHVQPKYFGHRGISWPLCANGRHFLLLGWCSPSSASGCRF